MFQLETQGLNPRRKGSILTFDKPRNLMMPVHKFYFISLPLLIFSSLSRADEVAEAVLSEVPTPVRNEQGLIVNPENAIVDLEDAKVSQDDGLQKPDPIAIQPPKDLIPSSLVQMGEGAYFSKYAFVLDKSTRTLSIWQNKGGAPVLLEAHPADMGRRSGDKQSLGDKRTPEGIYFFRTIYEAEMLNYDEYGSRAYTMDYPNLFDLRSKKTGSGIWLHAVPDEKSLYRGSRGCVVVRNSIIGSLGKYIEPNKTPIIVEKQVSYITKDQHKLRQTELLNWLQQWRSAWESKELKAYMNYYSDDFESLRMTKDQ